MDSDQSTVRREIAEAVAEEWYEAAVGYGGDEARVADALAGVAISRAAIYLRRRGHHRASEVLLEAYRDA